MNPEDFRDASTGQCIRSVHRPIYWAFVPHPLPPRIEVDWELATLLSAANSKLGELSGAGQLLPNPHLLINPFMRREAVTSSRIENTQSGLEELFLFEADETQPPLIPDVQEVVNYVRAMEYGIQRMQTLPLSSRFLCEIHAILMKGVRGEHATPGFMRTSQNWIGSPGCTLMDATYVPPPVPEMQQCLAALERYIHFDVKEPPLIQCALVHYQFEAIHPFVDGNGRIGRLLIILMLLEKKLLSQPMLYLSDFFEAHRDAYYQSLLNVSQKGNWKAWLTFFLNGIRQQSEAALVTTQNLLTLNEEYRKIATGLKVPKSVNLLIDRLFGKPIVSTSELAKTSGMSYPTVQRGVDYLIERGKLREITGKRRNRLFVADEILNIISSERTQSVRPEAR